MANQTIYPYGQSGQLPTGYPIADDLNTNSAQQALSARQGVVIKGLIDDLPEPSTDAGFVEVDMIISGYLGTLGNYINATDNVWKNSTATKSFFVPIVPGTTYRITASGRAARVAILRSDTDTVDTAPDYATGETALRSIEANETLEFTAQQDAYYLSINNTLSNNNIRPSKMVYLKDAVEYLEKYTDDGIFDLSGKFEEEVDYDTLNVLSNGTAISITKDGNGGILINNTSSSSGKYALIELPSTLVAGEKYRMTFKYSAGFTKAETWWLGFANSSYETTSGGVNLYSGADMSALLDFTHNGDNVYLRLASTSQNAGATVKITGFSISTNRSTVAEIVDDIRIIKEGSATERMNSLIRQARFIAESSSTKPLALLHFTDIHGDSTAAATIQNFYNAHSSEIDDMVQTGDTVYYYWNSSGQGYEWFQSKGLPQSLFVLGNHDGAQNSNANGWLEGSADWDFKGKEWDFDTYFADYITLRGITPPTGYDDPESPYYKACYWHKDYSNAKVRLIGLDCMHFNDGVRYTSNDQETWLAEKLQETLTSGNAAYGYSVICLSHYPLDDYSGDNETWNDSTHKFVYNQNAGGGHVMEQSTNLPVKCHYGSSFTAEKKFSMRNRVGTIGSTSYSKGPDNPLCDVIQTWINNGGKFIVWLSGHTHTEYMYYPAKYPNMLCLGLPQAGNTRGNSTADRSNASDMHTCANLLVIDTANTLLKIIRVGKTLDKSLMEFEYLSYNYTTKNVIR